MKYLLAFLLLAGPAWAHVPALLPPLKGTPVASYFLGQSDISRAVYSELTRAGDFFVAQFELNAGTPTHLQILTPECPAIPQYETFQPAVLLLKGDLPWKEQGETNREFIDRLKARAVAKAESNFPRGSRPRFYEPHGKQSYWVGGDWKGDLEPGLYALVVYSFKAAGTFSLGLNDKEAWTPDLYRYVGEVLPKIQKGLCHPRGFTGELSP